MISASVKKLQGRLAIILGAPALAAVGILVLLWSDPIHGPGLLPCFFHGLTGLYCIGCGATRALAALLHGDLAAALSYNLFMMIWLPWPAYALLGEWLRALAGRRIIPPIKDTRPLLWALLVSAILFFILRNLPWYPWNWLAP
ncbi:MAG: DUF2752 domain-containing protein [Clostridiaceae bacterium]|nr:DUF2752 domain-containing protein [Clostridiaceae bacterium]